ncbi:SAV_915 family protein [Streptomyces sp. NPDC051907]|uniref:SAV_915 family protein n=1 Tax=Streptomyces sp. NPDC051907 TaxID=3155284 RepID=UPI00342FAFDA
MKTTLVREKADPDERRPAGPLYVPVRLGSAGGHHVRFMRTALGVRTAIGFSSHERLVAVLGEEQPWIRLAAPALRSLAEPLGVTAVTVDPQLTAPPSAPRPAGAEAAAAQPCARRGPWDPNAAGALRVTAAAAFAWSAVTAIHTFLN